MTEQEFIDIAVEEGYTTNEAKFLWKRKPHSLVPIPTITRRVLQDELSTMKLARLSPEHEAAMAEYSG